MKLVLIMSILTLFSLSAVVNAVDPTTVGAPTVVGLTRLITIQAPYTGDDNNNTQTTFQYKRGVDGTWLDTFPMYVDRAAKISHGISYNLEPNTAYDLRVTFTDADGVTGSPWTGSITTKADGTRPLGTSPVYWVDGTNGDDTTGNGSQGNPWKTISRAVNSLTAGVTVRIKAGTYREQVTVSPDSALGSIGNPITFENAPGETVIIDGEFARTNGISIGRYGKTYYDFVIRGLTIRNTLSSNIFFSYSQRLTVEDSILEEARNPGSGAPAAVELRNNGQYLTFRRNTVTNTGAPFSGRMTGVSGVVLRENTGGEHSIYSNLFQGGRYDDAINTQPEGSTGGWVRDSEMYNNTIIDANDDGFQLEGGVTRVVAWGNTVANPLAAFLGLRIIAGPAYVFHNLFLDTRDTPSGAGVKTGQSSPGAVFVVHNSWINVNTGITNFAGGTGIWYNQTYLNNIFLVKGPKYYIEGVQLGNSNIYNYNVVWVPYKQPGPPGGNVVKGAGTTPDYATFADWQAASGQDANSIYADPLVDTETGKLLTGSPAIDAGMLLTGFTYLGNGPDIGAFEYDSGAPPTFSFILSTSPSSGTVIQGGSTTTIVTATLTLGTTQSVSFSASGLPTGASPSFSQNSCNPTCSSTLTITTQLTTPTGTYPIIITGIGGGLTRITSYGLTVSSTDATKPRWSNNQTNSTLAGVFVNHSIVLTDETALDYYVFEFDNGTGIRSNISAVDISGTQVTANQTVLINSTFNSTVRWRYYFNDTSNNWNSTDLFSYRIASAADTIPPVRSNGQPTGTLVAGTTQITISLTTNEAATCRYANTSGTVYGSMTNAFSTSGSTIHSRLITGLTNGSSYRYYARCNDIAGNANFDDYNISFSVGLTGENCIDADADSYYSTVNCTAGNDCNDNNNAANPSAVEICGNSVDENCDGIDAACPIQPPSPPPSGGGVVTIGNPVETPITTEPEVKEAAKVEENIGTVSLELITPDKVESGEMFNATVWLLSPVTSVYSLTVADMQQQVELEAGRERLVTVPVRAPEAKGIYTLTAAIDVTSRAKDIDLDYLPLFLYVSESRVGNETFVNVTVKNYESMSTELRVIKDGKSDAFFELIEGKKEYNRELKLTQAGEYKIIASASSAGKVIDTDEYLLTVAGEKRSDYRLILIIVFAFVVMVITLIVMIR